MWPTAIWPGWSSCSWSWSMGPGPSLIARLWPAGTGSPHAHLFETVPLAGVDQHQAILQCDVLTWGNIFTAQTVPLTGGDKHQAVPLAILQCAVVVAPSCLYWLEKASAHLDELEKIFSSKWLFVKLWHSIWTIMKSVTYPMRVCYLWGFKKRKKKLCRTNGSGDIVIFDRW